MSPFGIILILDPFTPTAIISIPSINSATPIMTDRNTAPKMGEDITKKDNTIAKAPTPTLAPFTQPGLCFSPMPDITCEIPANSNPTPAKIIANIAVLTGNAISMIPKISASTPSPTVPQRNLPPSNIPLMIFSSPTIIKIMPRM